VTAHPHGGAGRLLRTHFFNGLLHNDIISPRGDTELTLIQVIGVVTVPGLFFAYLATVRYGVAYVAAEPAAREAAVLHDRGLLLGFSMLALAFIAVLQWDRLLLDRRDLKVLGPLPLARRTLAGAKAAAALQFLALFAAAINLFPMLVFPLVSAAPGAGVSDVARSAAAHVTAMAGAAAFVGFTAMACSRAAAVRGVQAAVFVLLVQALFLLPRFTKAITSLDAPAPLALWAPPAWFVGLYGTLAGNPGRHGHALAAVAVAALLASGLGLVFACARSGRESAVAPSADTGVRRRRRPLLAGAVNRLLPRAPSRAVFWFVLQTVTRSAPHRLRLAAWSATGLATGGVPVLLYSAAGPDAWMRASVVVMFFVLVGLRSAFAIPASLDANWVFRMTAERDVAACHAGTRGATVVLALLPTAASLVPLAGQLSGWRLLGHLAFSVAWAVLSTELLLLRFTKVPFTCPYQPGRANLRVYWAAYLFGSFLYMAAAGAIERSMLAGLQPFAIGLACLTAAVVIGRGRRRHVEPLEFDEEPSMLVTPLGLTGSG
jgi:hypothetical protein